MEMMGSREHDSGHSLCDSPSDCEEIKTVRFLLVTCFCFRDLFTITSLRFQYSW